MEVLKRSYRLTGIKPEFTTYKASTLYSILSLWPVRMIFREKFVFLIFKSRILVLENFGNYILLVKSVFVVDWWGE